MLAKNNFTGVNIIVKEKGENKMSMIQKIQPEVTKAAKAAYEYVGPGHVFSKAEIQEAADLAKNIRKPEVGSVAEYFNPRAAIESPIAHETVDKAVVGQKLDIVEGHMFG